MHTVLRLVLVAVASISSSFVHAATLSFAPPTLDPVPFTDFSNNEVSFSSPADLQSVVRIEPSYFFAGLPLIETTTFTFTFTEPVEQLALNFAQSQRTDLLLDVELFPGFRVDLGNSEGVISSDVFTPTLGSSTWLIEDLGQLFTTASFTFFPGSALMDDPASVFNEYRPLGIGLTQIEYSFAATAPIPEPETYAMMLSGLGLLGWMRRGRIARA